MPIIYLSFFSSFLNFILLEVAQLPSLGFSLNCRFAPVLASRTEPNWGEQTLPLGIVIAVFRANDAKVKGPLLI